MTGNSKDFVHRLISKNLLDAFETRNVVVSCKVLKYYDFENIIKSILDFEIEYLKFRTNYYAKLANQDKVRIERMNKLKFDNI